MRGPQTKKGQKGTTGEPRFSGEPRFTVCSWQGFEDMVLPGGGEDRGSYWFSALATNLALRL